MATLTPTTAKGRTQYEKGTPFRTGDDQTDNQDGSGYVHDQIEYSGQEKDEQNSYAFYLQLLLQAGRLSLLIRNNSGGTINAGQLVYISGYDAGNTRFEITKARSNAAATLAHFFLQANLATATNGVIYACEEIGSLNTGGRTVNDPVYLDPTTAGDFTFTKPSGTDIPQIVGRVTTVHASVGKIQFITRGLQEFLIENLVDTANIRDSAITTAKINALAVTAAKLATDAVETAKIKDVNVTAAKLATDAVETAKIKDLNVTNAKIAEGAISDTKLADTAVRTAKINNLAVTTAKIDNLAVTEGKIAALAVTAAKIGALAVETAKIDNLAVTAAKLATDSVETAKIKNDAVTTAKIAALAVTPAEIAASAVETAKINNDAVTGAKLANAVSDLIPQLANLTVEAEGTPEANARRFTIQIQDSEGNNLAKEVLISVWLSLSTLGPAGGTIDSMSKTIGVIIDESDDPTNRVIHMRTTTAGIATPYFVKTGSGTLHMVCAVGSSIKSLETSWT